MVLVWCALGLSACGKSAQRGRADSGGATSTEAGADSEPNGGTPGEPGGGVGQGGTPACVGLACLAEAELVYQPTREWQRPANTPSDTNAELAENDYTPKRGASIALKFSSDASALDMTPTAGGSTVHGTRNAQPADRAFYELELFAGGRFVVQVEGSGLVAEHTVYGSGSPVVSSTRGVVTPAP